MLYYVFYHYLVNSHQKLQVGAQVFVRYIDIFYKISVISGWYIENSRSKFYNLRFEHFILLCNIKILKKIEDSLVYTVGHYVTTLYTPICISI